MADDETQDDTSDDVIADSDSATGGARGAGSVVIRDADTVPVADTVGGESSAVEYRADGRPLSPLPKGAIRTKNGGWLKPMSKERAQELARTRWERKSAAIRAGIADAGKQIPDMKREHTDADVVRVLAEQHTLNAYDASARGSASSLKILLEHGYPSPRDGRDADAPVVAGADAGDIQQLLAAFRAWRDGGASDAGGDVASSADDAGSGE